MRLGKIEKMSLKYFVIDSQEDDCFHVVYQIPGTTMFSSVATSKNESLAEDFAHKLNNNGVLLTHEHEPDTYSKMMQYEG